MRTRIFDFDAPPEISESPLFSTVQRTRGPRPSALFGSVVVHLLAVGLIEVTSSYLAWLHEDDFDWSRYNVQPIRLHLSEPIYFTANRGGPADPPSTTTAASKKPAASTTPPHRPAISPRLELPAPHEVAADRPVIVQPEFRPQVVATPANTPQLTFWARKANQPPANGEVITPGRSETSDGRLQLSAPPVPDAPNRQTTVGDVNVSLSPTSATASLSVQNAATVPVRVRNAKDAAPAAFEMSVGKPADVLAFALDHSDARDVEIARGLRNVPRQSAADSAGTLGAAGRTPASTPAKGAAPSRGPAESSATSAAVARNTAGAESAGRRLETAESKTVANEAVRSAAAPELVRTQHPSGGKFDVVVMQSATPDDLFDLGGSLTGNPVYTVYLGVGDRKEWLLEYCVPGRQDHERDAYQVNVDDAGGIMPPYAVSTAIPKSILAEAIPKHIVFHGVLTASGGLQNMSGTGASPLFVKQLLDVFKEWQFRPALRNRQPVEVEILLVIPARS